MGQQKQKEIHTQKNSRLNQLLQAFIQSEKAKGKRKSWIHALPHRVGKLLDYLEENAWQPENLDIQKAQGFAGWLDNGKRSHRTITSYLVAAGCFCKYLKAQGMLSANPFAEIRKPQTERRLPANIPRETQLAAILSKLNTWEQETKLRDKIKRYRAHVSAELQYSTGLRIMEAESLLASDIDLERGLVHVRNGKGGFDRVCFLNEYACCVLKLYIQRIRPFLRTQWHADDDSLFFTGVGFLGRMTNPILREAAAKEGCKEFTSHTLRHSLGYHLLRAGAPIRSIQQILGHRRLRNTEVYTKVDKEDLKSVLDAKHPRQWRQA